MLVLLLLTPRIQLYASLHWLGAMGTPITREVHGVNLQFAGTEFNKIPEMDVQNCSCGK